MLTSEEFYSLPETQKVLSDFLSGVESRKEKISEAEYESLLDKHDRLSSGLLYRIFIETSEEDSSGKSDKELALDFLKNYSLLLNPPLEYQSEYLSDEFSPPPGRLSEEMLTRKASDKSISAKKFHQKSIPFLLKKNDEKYHLPEEKVLAALENDKLYHVYQKCLHKLNASHSPKMLKNFLKAYFKTLKN
jgi:hypothetical protein